VAPRGRRGAGRLAGSARRGPRTEGGLGRRVTRPALEVLRRSESRGQAKGAGRRGSLQPRWRPRRPRRSLARSRLSPRRPGFLFLTQSPRHLTLSARRGGLLAKERGKPRATSPRTVKE